MKPSEKTQDDMAKVERRYEIGRILRRGNETTGSLRKKTRSKRLLAKQQAFCRFRMKSRIIPFLQTLISHVVRNYLLDDEIYLVVEFTA